MEAWNLFTALSGAFARQSFLTASLAAIMGGLPELQVAFVGWLQPHTDEDLVGRRWEPLASATNPDAPDIPVVLRSGPLELWVEPDPTRLEHHLNAIECLPQGRRALLFHIAAAPGALDKAALHPLHHSVGQSGLVWGPCEGAWDWVEFLPQAQAILQTYRNQSRWDFRTRLLGEFLSWWQTTPGLHRGNAPGDFYGLDDEAHHVLWKPVRAWLREHLVGFESSALLSGGQVHCESSRAPFDGFQVGPWPVDQIWGWNADAVDSRALRLTLRVPGECVAGLAARRWHQRDQWPILVLRTDVKGGAQLELCAAMTDWPQRQDTAGRQRGLLGAVQSMLHLCEALTALDIVSPQA